MNPTPTPAPLHDITGLVALPSHQAALMVGGAATLLVLALLAVWFFGIRLRQTRLTPKQRALAALNTLERSGADSYAFGVRASDVLRAYLHDEYGLDALNRTSLEFLESLRDHSIFDDNEKSSLAAFLEASDLLKFARREAAQNEMGHLLVTARNLVSAEKALPQTA